MYGDKPTILVVDDEAAMRDTFAVALEDDYRLVEAESGEEALEIMERNSDVNLVLLDYLLPPGMDGLEVLWRMKKTGRDIPVIFVTGYGTQKICRNAFKFGVNDYLPKPFTVDELLSTIKDVLGPPVGKKPPVERAVAFMEKQYHRPISARDVARGICVSYSHLARCFKATQGCSMKIWLNTLRIEKAKSLLKNTNMEIKEVAYENGIYDQNYFYRLFKKSTGKSPSEYKRSE